MKRRRQPLSPRHTPLKQAHVSKKLPAILLLSPLPRTQNLSSTRWWPKLHLLPRLRCLWRFSPTRLPNHWHQVQVCALRLSTPTLHTSYCPPLGLSTLSTSSYPQPYSLTVTSFCLFDTPHPQSLICKITLYRSNQQFANLLIIPERTILCQLYTQHPQPRLRFYIASYPHRPQPHSCPHKCHVHHHHSCGY